MRLGGAGICFIKNLKFQVCGPCSKVETKKKKKVTCLGCRKQGRSGKKAKWSHLEGPGMAKMAVGEKTPGVHKMLVW